MRTERLAGEELDRYLSAITAALVRRFDPERIVLFGSFARGDQNRASDVDLVVVASTGLPFCDRIGEAIAACRAASRRRPVEALVYTPAEWQDMVASGSSFAGVLAREGRVLYERESKPDRGPAVARAGTARP